MTTPLVPTSVPRPPHPEPPGAYHRPRSWASLAQHRGPVLVAWHDGWREGEVAFVYDPSWPADNYAEVRVNGSIIEVNHLSSLRIPGNKKEKRELRHG